MNPGPRLSVGETLNEVLALYQQHFGALIPVAFWLFLAVSIVGGLGGDGGTALLLAAAVLALAVGTLYQGMVVTLVHSARLGRRQTSVGELIGSVGPVLPTLIATSVLAAVGTLAGLVFFIVPGCILLTIWAVIAPAVVIERRDLSGAFRRSQQLTSGFGWPVFGAVIVANLVAGIAAIVLGNVGEAIAGGPLLRIVFGALAATFAAPISALVAAVLYYRLLELKPDPPPADAPPPVL
ncbi:MAG TPA: hypothetical protein VJL81_07290 [Solirubrobacterales bacterium]|nr:hypothetical protein [Solirubrobacterales bacterium]